MILIERKQITIHHFLTKLQTGSSVSQIALSSLIIVNLINIWLRTYRNTKGFYDFFRHALGLEIVSAQAETSLAQIIFFDIFQIWEQTYEAREISDQRHF